MHCWTIGWFSCWCNNRNGIILRMQPIWTTYWFRVAYLVNDNNVFETKCDLHVRQIQINIKWWLFVANTNRNDFVCIGNHLAAIPPPMYPIKWWKQPCAKPLPQDGPHQMLARTMWHKRQIPPRHQIQNRKIPHPGIILYLGVVLSLWIDSDSCINCIQQKRLPWSTYVEAH